MAFEERERERAKSICRTTILTFGRLNLLVKKKTEKGKRRRPQSAHLQTVFAINKVEFARLQLPKRN